ncbi:MAG: cobalt transporter CbiM [Hyphomonadaceae bacterium]|nr:cobalt transporter CbiM [Clostridia bacterium]
MHIPDGYLSPQTTIPAIVGMIPLWGLALKRIKAAFKQKQMPLLALCAAFSFVIMMFNVPVGQSSVHAVGAVFIAILLGPWAACIAVSIALVIQAFVFGDGGILAIGANCFNMAVAMPFVGYYVYKLIAGKSALTSKRGMIGIFAGSYFGINIAALLTAVEFGVQPLLFKGIDGNPLYGYYPLSVSVPTMVFEHTIFAGPIEGIVTMAAITYIARLAPHLLNNRTANRQTKQTFFAKYRTPLFGILTMVILTPIGLIATGTAWGEWGGDELKEKIGFIPKGFEKASAIWQAWMPDYAIPYLEGSFLHSSVGYIVSAVVGILCIAIVTYITSKIVVREHKGHYDTE